MFHFFTLSFANLTLFYLSTKSGKDQQDIKDALAAMYSNLCCYCESLVGVVDFPHIEHYKPKKKYPKLCYDWNNLHLGCQQCNTSKGDQFDIKQPILDCVNDIITDHLTYKFGTIGILRWPKDARGKTTIGHANLNRDLLSGYRLDVFKEVINIISEIKENRNDPSNQFKIDQLKLKCAGQYGSLIKWAMDDFLY